MIAGVRCPFFRLLWCAGFLALLLAPGHAFAAACLTIEEGILLPARATEPARTRVVSVLAIQEQSQEASPNRSRTITQGLPDSWETLRQLRDGTPIVVTTASQKQIRGRFARATVDTLSLAHEYGYEETLGRTDVREVRHDPHVSVGMFTGFGAVIGALAGYAVGRAHPCHCNVPGLSTELDTVYGALWGAGGGTAIGLALGQRRGQLVYRAK